MLIFEVIEKKDSIKVFTDDEEWKVAKRSPPSFQESLCYRIIELEAALKKERQNNVLDISETS